MSNPSAWDHQKDAVQFAIRAQQCGRPGVYLNHRVGAGKTRTALGVAKLLHAKRVLVVCPLVAIGVWQREVAKWWPGATTKVLRGPAGEHIPKNTDPLVCITNYDQLSASDARLQTARSWKPDLLILDEAHYIKTPSSKRTRTITKLARQSKFRLLLSGTPAHEPVDWWAQMRLVSDPGDPVWTQNFGSYKQSIAVMGGPNQTWIKGYREPMVNQIVQKHVLPYTHVVTREQLKLPESIESMIPVVLTSERGPYDQFERNAVLEWPEPGLPPPLESGYMAVVTGEHVLAKLNTMRQLCSGFFYTSDAMPGHPQSVITERHVNSVGLSKIRALQELLDARPGHRVIIAYNYVAEKIMLQHAFAKTPADAFDQGMPPAIEGLTDSETRATLADQFQFGDLPLLLVQYEAAGVALTLSRADTLVLFSPPLSAITYEQMRGRVDRPGKPNVQEILALVAEHTVEEDIYAGVVDKLNYVDLGRRLIDGMRRRTTR